MSQIFEENMLTIRLEQSEQADGADFVVFRQDPFIFDNRLPPVKSDEELQAEIYEHIARRLWLLWPEYNGAELQEQWQFQQEERVVNLYNFVGTIALTANHGQTIAETLTTHQAMFPGAVNDLQAITITDKLPDSLLGNKSQYPTHGVAYPEVGMFALTPVALGDNEYRRGQIKVDTLRAVVAHELTHPIDWQFSRSWAEAGYTWQWVTNEDGIGTWVADQPDHCVTDYATRYGNEDVCESVVAYLFDPDHLWQIAPVKYEIIDSFAQHRPPKSWLVTKRSEAVAPLLPESVTYYINENLFVDADNK